jgi:adenine-specific DNA-methyltransferase
MRLWHFLRRRHLRGHRFRRQVPVGPYILDFFCNKAQLAIEIDGSQNALTRSYDERRERYLANCGIRVLRFWNNEVLQQTDAVLEVVLDALESSTPKMPPP